MATLYLSQIEIRLCNGMQLLDLLSLMTESNYNRQQELAYYEFRHVNLVLNNQKISTMICLDYERS